MNSELYFTKLKSIQKDNQVNIIKGIQMAIQIYLRDDWFPDHLLNIIFVNPVKYMKTLQNERMTLLSLTQQIQSDSRHIAFYNKLNVAA